MNYIVLDLEWNMGSRREELKMMPFEIIEIGAIKLDENRRELGRFSRLIHPQVYRKMHWANKNVVHIGNEDLRDAENFEMVYSEFLTFCGDEPYMFCTWGDSDLTELQRNILYFNCIPLSDGPLEYLDVQKLFGYSRGLPKERVSLEKAVEESGVSETKGFHRAVNDAAYTAEILKRTDKQYERFTSFNTYHTPQDVDNEIIKDYGSYVKHISCPFDDKHELLGSKRLKKLSCPICNQKLQKEMPWFSLNGKHYLTLGQCEQHGAVKSKIRIKKDDVQNGVYAIKTCRIIDAEEIEKIRQRYQKSTLSKSE